MPDLDAVAARIPLRVQFDENGEPTLVPAVSGVRGALALVLAGAATAAAEGTWERLKICPADNCRWAFYDRSKNRSRRWCAMRVCGNREKTRTYRERKTTP